MINFFERSAEAEGPHAFFDRVESHRRSTLRQNDQTEGRYRCSAPMRERMVAVSGTSRKAL